jgi:hypothetical protein
MRNILLTAALLGTCGCGGATPTVAPVPQARPLPPSGLVCERTRVNRTRIEERDIDVTDWTIRFTNQSADSRWIDSVTERSSSEYLIQRNPKQITYKVMTLERGAWRDSFMGFSQMVGPRDTWIEIPSGQSLEFIVPIADQLEGGAVKVRLDFKVTADPSSSASATLSSEAFTHVAAPSDERQPE